MSKKIFFCVINFFWQGNNIQKATFGRICKKYKYMLSLVSYKSPSWRECLKVRFYVSEHKLTSTGKIVILLYDFIKGSSQDRDRAKII
jgi:hypothetical protein